jgi:nicotinate-nucleotide adenylyltransferase
MTPATRRPRVGVLGGTFDPIHFGHLDAAESARHELALDEVWLVPSLAPPHRPQEPVASAFHRFAMVALAVVERPQYRACDAELLRAGRSYTIDTLQELHARGLAPVQIFFIIGVDAFADIHTWRAYPAVLDAANFAVVSRDDRLPEHVATAVGTHAARIACGTDRPAHEGDTKIFLVGGRTRPASSTLVRARRRASERIDDLVPSCVAQHIEAHHLYEPVGTLHGQ